MTNSLGLQLRKQPVDVDGRNITYVFILRRQSDAPFEGCWMTEAVIVKPDEEAPDYNLGPPGVG